MPTYITLANYTEQGVRNIKEGPARMDAAREAFKAKGAELREIFLVTGQYDLVAIIEAPDDATIARLALAIGAQGNVRTETLRAFTEDEFRQIAAGLP